MAHILLLNNDIIIRFDEIVIVFIFYVERRLVIAQALFKLNMWRHEKRRNKENSNSKIFWLCEDEPGKHIKH